MAMNAGSDQIMTGAEVFGSDDHKLGMIVDVGDNYLLMQKGFLMIKDLYLPLNTVARVEEGRVYLNVPKERAERLATEKLPPAGDRWYGSASTGSATTPATTTAEDAVVTDHAISVPLREQEVVVMKQAVVIGEIDIRKETVTDVQRVTDTVRREVAHVEGVDGARLHTEGDLAGPAAMR